MTYEPDYFAEGADAALSGKSEDLNPYDLDTEETRYMAWADGWFSINEDGEDQ